MQRISGLIPSFILFAFCWRLDAIALDPYENEIPTWTKDGIIRGAVVDEQKCSSLPYTVWVRDGQDQFCIRYFKDGSAPAAKTAGFFFHGDYVGSEWNAKGYPIMAKYSGPIEGRDLFNSIVREAARKRSIKIYFISRPGALGSSGDHKKKFLPQESRVASLAVDAIKNLDGIEGVVLIGQSGGAALVANMLPKRSDVLCAVMASGAADIWQYSHDYRFAPDVYRRWENPVMSARLTKTKSDLYVLAGEGDTIRPVKYQKFYFDALVSRGLSAHFFVYRNKPNPHGLQVEALLVGELCAARRSAEEVRRILPP